MLFGAMVFRMPGVPNLFVWLNDIFNSVLESGQEGIKFVFGPLALGPGQEEGGMKSVGFILGVQGLMLIVFFSSLISLLYHIGLMNFLISGFARFFTALMRVSGAEALCVSANIFVGVESFLVVRPYVEKMTRSELFTILTAGLSTVASSVLGLYVVMLKGHIPGIAGHLMSASIMSAPAAFVIAKLMMPEIGQPVTLGKKVAAVSDEGSSNIIEAVINGANRGMQMVISIASLLIAFIGLTALLNAVIGFAGSGVNSLFGWTFSWSLENLLGYVFRPVAFLMGVPGSDVPEAGMLLGQRLIITEVASFRELAMLSEAGAITERTGVIMSYALCGFAHVASIAIFVGGAVSIVPSRKKEISVLGVKALVAAILATSMTGAVAGIFYMAS